MGCRKIAVHTRLFPPVCLRFSHTSASSPNTIWAITPLEAYTALLVISNRPTHPPTHSSTLQPLQPAPRLLNLPLHTSGERPAINYAPFLSVYVADLRVIRALPPPRTAPWLFCGAPVVGFRWFVAALASATAARDNDT